MRLSLLSLAAAAALAACGPGRAGETSAVPSLEPRSPSRIMVYQGSTPRCGFRQVGTVVGQTYREIQAAAFRLRANAVILEPQNQTRANILEGAAVQFTSPGCQS